MAGMMAQQLRVLVLQRTLVQVPASTRSLTAVYNFSSRGCNILFWPLRELHKYGLHT